MMSKIQITPFFKFCRVKVLKQTVDIDNKTVKIKARPDKRYSPVCSFRMMMMIFMRFAMR